MNTNYYLSYRYKYNKFPSLKYLDDYPPCIQIEPTSICNLRCIMCYQSDKSFSVKSGGFMGRPRYAVMQHMLHENLALITRRVMQKPFNFSFVTDKIFAHGTIASDNKGIEYAFPLYQYDLITSEKKSNLASKLFSTIEDINISLI